MRKISLLFFFAFLSSFSLCGQSLAPLEVSKEIVRGSLPNGTAYYLINNNLQKGFADFAVVQKEDLDSDRDKKALTYLPHFGLRKPYRLMSESGVGFGKDGFTTKLLGATYFHFRDVPTYKSAVTDSTLLMIMDLTSVSRKPQAIIISGDIDIAKVKERLNLLSIMTPKLENSVEKTQYKWTAVDSIRVISNINNSKNITSIEAIYRSARQSQKDMGTAIPLVIRSYSNILERIVKERLSKVFADNSIPLVDFEFNYLDSSQGPYDELFSFKLYTNSDCINKAIELLSSQLSAIDNYGATIEEVHLASIFDKPNSTIKQFERHITNEEYIQKCIAAYLYGANLAPENKVNDLINNSTVSDAQKQKLFNNYASALLDANKNLTLRVTAPFELNNAELKNAFVSAWRSPLEPNFAHGIPRSISVSNRAKIKEEATDPISNGKLWTFSNGIKVVYKHIDTKGEMSYSLVLNGGLSLFPKLSFGQVPYTNKIFDSFRIAGTSVQDFRNYLAKEGISLNQNAQVSTIEISGTAPSSKLDNVLSALLSLTNDSSIDHEHFNTNLSRNYSLQESMSTFKVRNTNQKMSSVLLQDYPYLPYELHTTIDKDFSQRAALFYSSAYSRINDGILIIVGDLDEEESKKTLSKYLGEFHTDTKPSQRVVIKDTYFKGIASIEDESNSGSIGGSELSANLTLSCSLPYSADNWVAFQAALKVLQRNLSVAMLDCGAYLEFQGEMDLFPSECGRVYINAHPCNANGLPLGIVPLSCDEIMEKLLDFISNVDSIEISEEDTKAIKALLNSEYEAIKDNPSTIQQAVKLRYCNGKDMVSNTINSINNLSSQKIHNILSLLCSSTRIEYIIR